MSTAAQAGAEARDAGANLALEAEARKHELAWAITKAARTYPRFTSDEVREILAEIGVHELEHPNALGACFLMAARAGIIKNTGTVRKAAHPAGRRRAVAVWQSLITKQILTTSEGQ